MIDISSCNSLILYLQTDLEEAKAQEVTKLQNSLQEMQAKLDEANASLVKEREAAKKAIEEAPPVVKEKEVLVEDTKKIESLTAEVEGLKVSGLIHWPLHIFLCLIEHVILCTLSAYQVVPFSW